MSQTLYLRLHASEIAPRVLLTGDPARVERIAGLLDGGRVTGRNREYTVASGRFSGQLVSAVSAGIGAPSTAIALEEFGQLGVEAVVRVGTMMGVDAPMGSVVLSTGAARFEGTSRAYLSHEFPAVPHWGLSQALIASALENGLEVRAGMTATYDAFYPGMAPQLTGGRELDIEPLRRARVLALDMETSLVYVLGTVLGIAAASACLVTVQARPHAHLEADLRSSLEEQLIRAALGGLIAFRQ
jgi:uridine phosphorylase